MCILHMIRSLVADHKLMNELRRLCRRLICRRSTDSRAGVESRFVAVILVCTCTIQYSTEGSLDVASQVGDLPADKQLLILDLGM